MDGKRKSATQGEDDNAPPRKKQANGDEAHRDDGMPWKEGLETFQKDAIWRQMNDYKREKDALETQIEEMSKRAAYHDDHLRIIDAWFRQLLDEVTTFAGADQPLNDASEGNTGPQRVPSALLFSNNETFQNHLRLQSKAIKSALSRLFKKWSEAPAPDLTELQGRLNRLLAVEKEHEVEAERLRSERDRLEEQVEKASQRYKAAEQRLDRMKSAAVAKLEKQGLCGNEPMVTRATPKAGNEMVNADLEKARNEAVAVAEKQKSQIEKLQVENQSLVEQVTSLTIKVSSLSDDDYAQSDLFKFLKSQHEDVIHRVNHLEAINIQLREEASTLHAERTAYRAKIQSEIHVPMAELQQKVKRAETDLARIRAARDGLATDVAMRKATTERERVSYNQMKELVAAKEDRIKALETEVERLQLQIGASRRDPPTADELGNLKVDDLASKYRSLEQEYALINKELPSMAAAWKKTSALASKKIADTTALEEKVGRLQAEKSKADQKYFATMKLNEAREGEVKTLRAQNHRSSEIVVQLKGAEIPTLQLISNLEKQLAETRDALSTITGQNRSLQQQIAETSIMSRGVKDHTTQLSNLLRQKDVSLVAATKSQRQLETETEWLRVRLAETEKSVEHLKGQTSGNDSLDSEALRKLIFCSVCSSRIKDTTLKTCGHLICRACVDERITSRSRRCPLCNKSFGASDAMTVHM